MNCERIQQEILLGQAGELSERELEKLGRHLDSCESCRKYSEQTNEIMALARTSLPSNGPGQAVIGRILAAARDEVDHKPIMFQMTSMRWVMYSAAAALVMCAVGLWSFRIEPASSASQWSAIIMAVGSEEHLNVISRSGKAEKGQEIQALASHLLIMEGFVADELPEVDVIDVGDEPLPTALQSRSIDASELKRCV